ncbi:mechanosensitive ion channel [Flavobacterium salilacus subsp. salilacus]|uniref:mechanosensitive ion channel family protein n=1 Tax=Flavobacterium TaxID=237 RepID=UPI001074DC0C|nr:MULTISPECIES: mechanosensitive ion channel domain-containing protein [Flavobacterium]KAF2519313.1 mechanosensitive ion channel [Flavobacterium salilacus subsp. salilacus]MBE1613504.1 mechanosensitive ion channel [Flavobacterium sp. SaA2.13]
MELLDWSYPIFKNLDFSDTAARYGSLLVNLVFVVIIAYVLDFLSKKILIVAFDSFAKKTKTSFDDFLIANKASKHIAHLIPLLFIYYIIPLVLKDFLNWEILFERGINIFMILLILWIVRSILNALRDYLKIQPNYSDKPIDSYIQVVMIVLWIFAVTAMVMLLFSVDFLSIIGTFGAVSAIILLIFKDTILGFVASIQVSVNDLVRIGDWITMEKYGADGDVIEINLATVKVRNFDNTTTTVPTYSLISDSFKNWRGMVNSGGRRIKRHVLIKANSVRFVNNDEIEKFKKIQLLSSYIEHRQADIEKYNANNAIDKTIQVNGRNLTNLGLFRKYISEYVENHPAINKDLTMMCRHLQPTEKGIPVEIYAFTSDKRWANYEYIMADIFDHVIASVKYFDLEIFELPSQNNAPFVED